MTTPGQLRCATQGRLHGVRGWSSTVLLLGTLAGCASAPPSEVEIAYAQAMSATVELATTRTEELALERAESLPPGEPAELDGGTVVAGPMYVAASGRRCRELTIDAQQRLACEDLDAEVWVFVPNVFAAGPATSGDEAPSTAVPSDEGEGAAEEGAS